MIHILPPFKELIGKKYYHVFLRKISVKVIMKVLMKQASPTNNENKLPNSKHQILNKFQITNE